MRAVTPRAQAGKPARAARIAFAMKTNLPPLRARASLLAAIASAWLPCAFAQTPTLRETHVAATRFSEPEASLPLGVSVISADEIRASGAATVGEAITRLLGVPARQDLFNGGDATLDLRGFGATADNNQVVLLDGIRLTEADLSAPRYASIPVDSVERIEVLRGSGAVLYGEGATGGVIVITTKAGAGRQPPTGASIYGGAGSDGLREARASADVYAGHGFGLDAQVQKRRSEGFRVNSASDSQAAALGGQWSGEGLRLGVRYFRDELDAGLPGALGAAQYASDPHQSANPQDHVSARNERVSAFGQAELGAWQLAFDAGHRQKQLRSINVSTFGVSNFDFDIDATTYALRARHEGSAGAVKNILVLGTDIGDWRREVLGSFGSVATQRSRGFYGKDDVILASGTRISFGARTERVEKDSTSSGSGFADREQAWELGASQRFGTAWTAYARVGRSFRLPNVDEFNFTTPGVTLVPQVSRDAEVGARWSYAAGRLEARLYRSALNNEIGFDPNAVGPFSPASNGANVNFDPTRRRGLELDWRHALTSALDLRLNAAWREASFRSGRYAGNDVPLVPRRTLAARADWKVLAGHRFSGGVNWVSSQRPDFENACRIPAYAVADARYAWQFHRNAELALGVTNLFDRKYFSQAFRCTGGVTEGIFPEPGRQFTAAVRMQF
jgi:iron complex outermembrane recepter protein